MTPNPAPTILGYKRHISEPVPSITSLTQPIPQLLIDVDGTYDHERMSMRCEATVPAGHPAIAQLARYMREQGAKLLSPALPKWWVLSGDDYELSLSIGTENACITLHDFDWAAPVDTTHSALLSLEGGAA
tara:strand:+ start:277 stop:669 length:393 start_codon:yes stop_codon:yes gene_type:complete